MKSTEFKNPYEKNGTGGEKRENMKANGKRESLLKEIESLNLLILFLLLSRFMQGHCSTCLVAGDEGITWN